MILSRLLTISLVFFCFLGSVAGQTPTVDNCASTQVMNKWLHSPLNKQIHEQVEQKILEYKRTHPNNNQPNIVVTLPVVVHIIHNNGSENISDAQVIQGIQHLNQAFANTAPYDPSDGVDCQIQFCLAKRDPNGNATTGITRNISTLTNMNMDTDDIAVKNLNRWNPLCYINIWLVNEICNSGGCGVAGYAYFPSAHGSAVDGIMQEARWFGSTSGNSVVQIHEMGHYLGLYHTFQGGCTNNNCLTDGDRVCDTPPDQSTAGVGCNGVINSCSTDALSGFTTDQNDLTRDYMDYGSITCFSMFTQGQADRMNWHIQNVRSSLLNCMSCLDPCPAPVTANFTSPGATVNAGSSFIFTNTSTNATTYEWYVNGVLTSTATNFNFTFTTIGTYTIKLIAKSSSPLCSNSEKTVVINAVCPVTASFTKSAAIVPCGTNINFTNTSSNANTYEWYVNGALQSTAVNFTYTNTTAGRYGIKLIAKNSALNCTKEFIDTVEYTCAVVAAFTPNGGSVNINTPVNFTNASTGATGYQWLVNGLPSSTATNFSYSFTTTGNYSITLIASNGICSTSKTVYYVSADTCLRQTFQKTYNAAGDEFIQDLRSTPDGGFIAAGRTNSFGAGSYDGLVVKYDNAGNIQFTKTYGGTGLEWLYRIKPITGGGYITIGATSSFGAIAADALIMKLDNNGNVVWARRFGENTNSGEHGTNVIQTLDGGFLFSAVHNRAGGTASSMLIKLDNNGNVQWNRLYDMGNTDEVGSVLEEENNYTMIGQFRGSTFHDLYMMKVNKTNGNIISVNTYDVDGRNNFGYEVSKVGNKYELVYSMSNDFSPIPANPRTGVLRLDSLGNVVHSKFLNTSLPTAAGFIIPLEDGSYFAGHSEFFNSDLQLYKYGSTGILQWGNKYVTPGEQLCYTANPAADGGYLVGGLTKTGAAAVSDITVIKTDIIGGTPGCTVQAVTASLTNIPVVTGSITFTTRPLNFTNPVNITIQAIPQTLGSTQLCSGTTCVVPGADSCSQNTFRKSYGGTGDDYINDVKNTSDGGHISVGVTNSFGAGNYDAAVIKTDNAGNIVWNRIIGGTGADYLQRVITTSDGGYMAAGYTGSFGATAAQEGWLVKLNATGAVQWSRKYSDGNPNGSVIWDVIQTSDGGYAFCGTNRYTPGLADAMVGKVNALGIIQWCKNFNGTSSDQAWGVLEANGQLVVSAFGVSLGGGAFYDGVFMKLNITTGAVIFARSYEIENRSNWFTYMYKQNGEYLLSCNNANDYSGSGLAHITLQIDSATGIVNRITRANAATDRSGADMVIPTSDGGYMLFQSEGAAADIHFRKNDNAGSLQWLKKYGAAGTDERMYSLVQTPDKGFFGGGVYTGGTSRDFLFMRTDATGNQGGTCVTATDVGDNSTPAFSSALFTWPSITNINIPQNNTVTPSDTSVNLTLGVNCSGPTCIEITDSCSIAAFQKVFNAPGDDIAYNIKKVNTGSGYIIAGQTTSSAAGLYDPFLVRTTNDGEVVWAKNYGGTGDEYFVDVEQTSDGGFIAAGQTKSFGNSTGAAYLVKTDINGTVQWARAFGAATGGGELFRDVVQTSDGGYAMCGTYNTSPSVADLLLVKVDASGNLQWTKKYATSSTDEGTGLLEENDSLVVIGYFRGGNFHDAILMKVNKANGNVHWTKAYDSENDNNVFYKIQRITGGYSLFMPVSSAFTNSNSRQAAIRTDINGNITYAHKITSATNKPFGSNIIYNQNGGYTTTASEESNNGDIHFYSINSQRQSVWKKRFTRPGNQNIYDLRQETGGYYFMTGIYNASAGAPNDILFIRTDAGGNTQGCTMDSTDMVAAVPALATVNYTPTVTNNTFGNTTVTPTVNNIIFTTQALCASITHCDSIKLTGKDSTCNLRDTLTYTVQRSAGCNAPIFFTTTPITGFQIINTTDTTIKIKFLQTGQVMIRAKIETPCAILEDSLLVTVFNSPDSLNLGPDISLCSISTITLHAGAGFKSYKWQDGATDSIYTANFPGTYHVTTEDYCGNIYRDTVIITLAPNVPFDLGTDLIRCNDDTLTITAPAGFNNYTWASNYNISSLTGRTVRVWPAIDTVYVVVAEKAPGCLVYDSIRVRVYRSPIINLGNDTSFCVGNNITLNAPTGFTNYVWSTGATGTSITVNTAGTYWLEGTTAQGCKSRDTMRVLNLYPAPVVDLGHDTSFCHGYILPLNAGNPGSTYLWQNGTTGQTLAVSTPGLYWVQVTNANGCSKRDSLRVFNVYPSPVVNIGNDTSFCAGNSITLNAGNPGLGYIWQNGATTQTITASAAGLYWVLVYNGNNCSTRDSMRILNLFPKPVINFGRDTVLCEGSTLILNAGNTGSTYLWHNGSTTQTITVSTAGTYWVRVTAAGGCIASDTIRVLRISPLPANFVLPRIGMCDYETIYMHAIGNYNSYLWSTGATRDSALIVRPGNYWLQVTTTDGCTARENFEVFDKNCLKEIYFPTGFTPNRDGLNDVYKPGVFGILESYRLEIYNRYGERIFFTTDYSKGWDGSYKGTAQGVGAFVWVCSYKFKDQAAGFKKGTMMLIR
jgi:gliding motility-associated-like protein